MADIIADFQLECIQESCLQDKEIMILSCHYIELWSFLWSINIVICMSWFCTESGWVWVNKGFYRPWSIIRACAIQKLLGSIIMPSCNVNINSSRSLVSVSICVCGSFADNTTATLAMDTVLLSWAFVPLFFFGTRLHALWMIVIVTPASCTLFYSSIVNTKDYEHAIQSKRYRVYLK